MGLMDRYKKYLTVQRRRERRNARSDRVKKKLFPEGSEVNGGECSAVEEEAEKCRKMRQGFHTGFYYNAENVVKLFPDIERIGKHDDEVRIKHVLAYRELVSAKRLDVYQTNARIMRETKEANRSVLKYGSAQARAEFIEKRTGFVNRLLVMHKSAIREMNMWYRVGRCKRSCYCRQAIKKEDFLNREMIVEHFAAIIIIKCCDYCLRSLSLENWREMERARENNLPEADLLKEIGIEIHYVKDFPIGDERFGDEYNYGIMGLDGMVARWYGFERAFVGKIEKPETDLVV